MLTHILIRDFAIVDQLELELGPGLTALTGETGAGKSILIGAAGLALGDRADSGVIRHGAERAEIHLEFDLSDAPDARNWLAAQDLANDNVCLIRRVLTQEGRSRAYINGVPSPLQSLKTLGEMLVDIHGQHQHQSLLKREVQRQLLDDYAGNGAVLQKLAELARRWKQTRRELDTLQQAGEERDRRLDYLRHQVEELQALDLAPNELQNLDEEHARLAHAGRLQETGAWALDRLYESEQGSVYSQLNEIVQALQGLCNLDPGLQSSHGLLAEALIQVQEAADELRHYQDHLELDPGRLQDVEARLGQIHDVARKHRLEPAELAGLLTRLDSELQQLLNSDVRLEDLHKELQTLTADYDRQAGKLSAARAKAAQKLHGAVAEQLHALGMAGARFEVALKTADESSLSPYGRESVEFLVSTNPGQPPRPLAKIASGGELSRVSLAIQVIMADAGRIPTLVYDEVDAGIGGPTAEVVGQRLRRLGSARQVLCVTHLPQVAAQAHQHARVEKKAARGQTQTRITALSAGQRVEEIARMLGGVKITAQSRAHAEEMIGRGTSP